jgi:FkbH-like protein
MVEVPEMGDDPARYRDILDRAGYFETIAFSDEDRKRAEAYRKNAQRAEAEAGFTDVDGFLESLAMRGTVGQLDEQNLPRFVQLLNKSNQFHLTTTRYNEAQVRGFLVDAGRVCLYFRLEDRFGDNGLIATVILDLPKAPGDPLVIDTWAMSCRVLSRGVERFILSEIRAYAARSGARVVGRYIPTPKNALVAGLYESLGFRKLGNMRDGDKGTFWELLPDSDVDLSHHIRRIVATQPEETP